MVYFKRAEFWHLDGVESTGVGKVTSQVSLPKGTVSLHTDYEQGSTRRSGELGPRAWNELAKLGIFTANQAYGALG